MLWTDKIFITVEDLQRIDSEIAKVAEAEEITLLGNNGLIRGAMEECSHELQKLVVAFGGYVGSGDLSPNHLAAVMNIGQGSSVRQKALLSQIVVSGEVEGSWNWIKQWAAFSTLNYIYRDAFNRTVKDRYEGKMRFYKSELQRRFTPSLYTLGIPLVTNPLAAPAAVFERDSGSWGPQNVDQVNGPGAVSAERDVVVTYVDMSQANYYVDSNNRGNSESHPSDRVTIELQSGKVIQVTIDSLRPPTGRLHSSQMMICAISPKKATHWNVYVGAKDGPLYLQNQQPISIATKTFTLSGDPILSGPTAGIGQYYDRRMSLALMRQRA